MSIERIEMSLLRLPYVHFFETSFGRAFDRTFIIIKAFSGGVCGYGECVAEEAPLYGSETTETAWHILKDFLIPLVFRKGLEEPGDFAREAGIFRGNLMAKAGLELALWDHAKLQREMKTPLCLDESILSLDTTRAALEMGSCRVINIKVGRVGGPVEMRRIHDHCEAHGVPVR